MIPLYTDCALGYIYDGKTCVEEFWHGHPYLFLLFPVIVVCVVLAILLYVRSVFRGVPPA